MSRTALCSPSSFRWYYGFGCTGSPSIADFASAEADARLQFNDSSRVINETVNIRGVSGELNVLSGTTASPYSKISLSNFSASVAGLSLSGSAEIEQLDGELVFAFSNVTSSFGADFDSLISLTNGQGILVVGDTDVAGSIGVDVAELMRSVCKVILKSHSKPAQVLSTEL